MASIVSGEAGRLLDLLYMDFLSVDAMKDAAGQYVKQRMVALRQS
jgi:hypothetical protein